jgi:hypothetical protein
MKLRTIIDKFFYERKHSSIPRLSTNNPRSRASHGQDIFVAENLPNTEGQRVFVEIGGNDGITLSNTFYLESEAGWHGISVEPLPRACDALAKNRECITVNACISDYDGETRFYAITGPEMLSGIPDKYDKRHERRVRKNLKRRKGTAEEITTPCFKLETVLEKH